MKNKGWIKLHRKVLDSEMYQELNSKQRDIMMQILILANHNEQEYKKGNNVFKCIPGQFFTSREKLKKVCAKDVSIRNIRTALVILEKWEFLTNKTTNAGRLITVCNWEKYQGVDTANVIEQPTKRPTLERKKVLSKKEVKKETLRKDPPIVPPELRKGDLKNLDLNQEFEIFWTQYHLITGRLEQDEVLALRYWKRLNEAEREKSIERIQPYYDSKTEKKYCRAAWKYLDLKNFNDQLESDRDPTIIPRVNHVPGTFSAVPSYAINSN